MDVPSVAPPVEEHSSEEERQVKGLYASLISLANGVDDVIVCKAVAVFMGTLLTKSEQWKKVIPGFMNHMDIVANVALTYNHVQEQRNASSEEGTQASGDSKPEETTG